MRHGSAQAALIEQFQWYGMIVSASPQTDWKEMLAASGEEQQLRRLSSNDCVAVSAGRNDTIVVALHFFPRIKMVRKLSPDINHFTIHRRKQIKSFSLWIFAYTQTKTAATFSFWTLFSFIRLPFSPCSFTLFFRLVCSSVFVDRSRHGCAAAGALDEL